MSEAVWILPKVTSDPNCDFTRSSSGTAVGTAGVLLVGAKKGRLYRLSVQNGAATAYFLQVFDKATAPVNADVPIWVKRLPLSSEVELNFDLVNGLYFALGCGFAISSTAGSLTLAAGNDIAFYAALYTKNG